MTIDVTSKVKVLKERLRKDLADMPTNKMQLRRPGTGPGSGFLKDSMSLAQLNVGGGAVLDFVPKVRGGRK